MQPQIENEDATWPPRCHMLVGAKRTNKRRELSLQEVELDGRFLILHIVLETVSYNSCTLKVNSCSVQDWSLQCPSNAIWPLQIIPLPKQSFKMQPQIENEDVTQRSRCNLLATRTNKHRALSLQEVELDCWFLILRIILKTCTL